MRKCLLITILTIILSYQGQAQTIPPHILEHIKKSAAKAHPNDYAVQEHLINMQVIAHKQIQNISAPNIPTEKLNSIISSVESQYPKDFVSQNYFIEQQIAAFRRLSITEESIIQSRIEITEDVEMGLDDIPIDVIDRIKKRHAIRYEGNFTMQEIMFTNDVNAYLELRNYKNDGVPRNVIEQIKREQAINHRDNYIMQKIMLDNDVRSYLELNE